MDAHITGPTDQQEPNQFSTTECSSPIDIIRRVYTAFAGADLAAVIQLCSPEVVVTQDPDLPWGGRYVGHQGVVELVAKLTAAIESTVTVEALFQAGDEVIQYGRTTGTVRANGIAFDVPECHLWAVQDGQIIRAQFFIDSEALLGAIRQSSS